MDDRVPRKIGRLRGMLVVLIGCWVATAAQLGPAVDFGFAPDRTWALTDGQIVLQVVPGVLVVIAGIAMMITTRRRAGALASWLAAAAGAWLVAGPVVTATWDDGSFVGRPLGTDGERATTVRAVLEHIAMFSGVGVLLIGIAATAATRFLVHEMHDAYDADGERQLREFNKRHREDLRALRHAERTDRRAHRGYVRGLDLFRGPAAATRPMPTGSDSETWSTR